MQRGYYYEYRGEDDLSEITFVSGKKTGNYYYNPWADEPRWSGIMFSILKEHPPTGESKIHPPAGIPPAPGG